MLITINSWTMVASVEETEEMFHGPRRWHHLHKTSQNNSMAWHEGT